MIIYRHFPFGSKKLSDCTPVVQRTWHDYMTKPYAFHFDQECIDINRLPLRGTVMRWNGQSFPTETKFCYFRNICEVPYHLSDLPIVVHSEQNSSAVKTLQNNGFATVHWFSHGAIARDWFRYAEHDPALQQKNQSHSKRFLIYNRAWSGTREYRLALAGMLAAQGLVPHCLTSLSFVDGGRHYSEHVWRNTAWKSSLVLEDFFAANMFDSTASADYVTEDYQSQILEIVLETIFDTEAVSLTEKSLRPIATATPFVVAGAPGSLQYLRSYGFETFSPWINESYDHEPNAAKRLSMIVQEMSRLAALSSEQFRVMLQACQHIAYRNRAHFFSYRFQQQIFDEYRNGIQNAVNQAQNLVDTSLWNLVKHLHPSSQQQWVNQYLSSRQ